MMRGLENQCAACRHTYKETLFHLSWLDPSKLKIADFGSTGSPTALHMGLRGKINSARCDLDVSGLSVADIMR